MTSIELQSAIIVNPLPFTIELFKGKEKKVELKHHASTTRTLSFDGIACADAEKTTMYVYPRSEIVKVPVGSIVSFEVPKEPGKLNLWYKQIISQTPVTIPFLRKE